MIKNFNELMNEGLVNGFENVPEPGDVVDFAEVNIYGECKIQFKSGKVVKFITENMQKKLSSTVRVFRPGWFPAGTPESDEL